MTSIVYLIRNGDLHKIGTTKNLIRRMKQLKPDEIISTLETTDYRAIEKELHRKYKDVRLPQSEYFRLSDTQVNECIQRLSLPFPWMTVVWIGTGLFLVLALGIAIYTNMPFQ